MCPNSCVPGMSSIPLQASVEDELAEAVRRSGRLQAQVDDVGHQRDRLQASLASAEESLRAAEAERGQLAEAQERLRAKGREAADMQDELSRWAWALGGLFMP